MSRWRSDRAHASRFTGKFQVPDTDSDDCDDGEQAAHGDDARVRRGGGGAWRAFIHQSCAGVSGRRPDLQALAEAYRNLSDEEKDRLRELGKQGTEQHKLDPSSSPFGPSRAMIDRHLEQRAFKDQLQRIAQNPNDDERNRDMAKSVMVRNIGASPWELISAATRQGRALTSFLHSGMRSMALDLQRFAKEGYSKAATSLASIASSSSPLWSSRLVPVPDKVAPRFMVRSNAASVAMDLASWTFNRSSPTSGLAQDASSAMELDWMARHQVIQHSTSPSIGKVLKNKGGTCWAAGYCVCKAGGKQLVDFRTSFLKGLAYRIPATRPLLREALTNKLLFVELVGFEPTDLDDIVGGQKDAATCAISRSIFHIGTMYLLPFRPTLHSMKVLEVDPETGEVALEATGNAFTLWSVARQFEVGKAWCMRFFLQALREAKTHHIICAFAGLCFATVGS